MAYEFMEFTQSPNDYYRDLAQAFIDSQWENTAARSPEQGGPIFEQQSIGLDVYCPVEAWIKPTVGDVTSGMRDSRDYLKLVFKDINHISVRGLYYKFMQDFWIVNDYNEFTDLVQDVGIRRCNNQMRIVDPDNGSIFSIPCVIDYDMASPSAQVSQNIITPNNHAVVKVQGNEDTLRLFKLNTRYIFGGRSFKLYGYQNALNYDLDRQTPTYLELDLYLDEIHDKDDLERQLADNGNYIYSVSIDSSGISNMTGYTGSLTATVMLNGVEVKRDVCWKSSDDKVIQINNVGQYKIVGKTGQSASILAYLGDDDNIADEIPVTVSDVAIEDGKIVLNQEFEKIRQNETRACHVFIIADGAGDKPDWVDAQSSNPDILQVNMDNDGRLVFYCERPAKEQVRVNITCVLNGKTYTREMNISCVSMFG